MFYYLNTVLILNIPWGHSPQILQFATRFLVMQIFDEKMCSRLKIIGSIEKRFILKPPCNLSKSAFIRFNLLDTFWNPFQIFPNSERIKIRIFLKSKSRPCFLKSPVLQHEELRTFRLVWPTLTQLTRLTNHKKFQNFSRPQNFNFRINSISNYVQFKFQGSGTVTWQ